jgi:trehalose/maltose hydrolase-like predicted phosphorylase
LFFQWAATGLREQHISADISLSVWQFYMETADVEWLAAVGMPILTGVADFYLSKSKFDASRQTAHLNDVIPPDEYVDHVDDSVYTNFAAAEALRFTLRCADIVGVELERAGAYSELASALVILFDEAQGIHPEYLGYNGSAIKQADVVMLHYPWGLDMSAAVQQADLQYYAARSDEDGPAMTWGMHAIGFKDLGMFGEAARYFERAFRDNMQPPFMVWTETPTGNAGNFITGAGGFLQTVTFGYPGLRIEEERLLIGSPACPAGAAGIKLRGVWYRGSRLDVSYHCPAPPSSAQETASCSGHLAEEITVRLTTAGGASLRLLQYDSSGEVVATSEELSVAEEEVTMSVPCDDETSGTTFSIVQQIM